MLTKVTLKNNISDQPAASTTNKNAPDAYRMIM